MGGTRHTPEFLYKKALRLGQYYFRNTQIAQDFASWYIIKILEGRGQHQTFRQASIDFTRLELGRFEKFTFREIPMSHFSEKKEQAILNSLEAPPVVMAAEFNPEKIRLSKRQARILILFMNGMTRDAISKKVGLNPGLVGRILKEAQEICAHRLRLKTAKNVNK